jgi:hypothetical protein
MISEKKYREAMAKVDNARKRVARIKDEAEGAVMQVVQTAEVNGSAFTHALVEGYWNGVELLGVPLPLLTGSGLHILGAVGIAPTHMHNFGDGAYASYSTTVGLGIGEDMRRKAGKPTPAAASEGLRLTGDSTAGAPLTDAELAALANAA